MFLRYEHCKNKKNNIISAVIHTALFCLVSLSYLSNNMLSDRCYYYSMPGGCGTGHELLTYIAFIYLIVYLAVQGMSNTIKIITR